LGGGSLELVNVDNNILGAGVSFPIGPLRFADISSNRKDVNDTIARYIKKFPLKKYLPDNNFYAVGGAFRNLAKMHMSRKNYPLKVLHNYAVDAEDMMMTAQVISRMSEDSLAKINGVSKKRAGSLPFAALILKNIIEIGKPKQVVFSTSGVREGFLYSQLADDIKEKDPLICGAIETMNRMHRIPEYGYELANWMQPLFLNTETENEKRLRLAACIMSEISAYENTEYRAELAYRRILDSSLIGLDHAERVFIATALYCRYSSFNDDNILSTMATMLSSKKVQNAQIIGTAMRLARTISGSSVGVLDKTKLKLTKNILYLNMSKGASDLCGESVQKRFQQLAELLGREAKIS
jgi:exopolyphosphatase/guanosine-5'-triphosphate,3'-diphosphate pyrophosphatase